MSLNDFLEHYINNSICEPNIEVIDIQGSLITNIESHLEDEVYSIYPANEYTIGIQLTVNLEEKGD